MDPRFSSLPHSTQAALGDAAKALDAAKSFFAQKRSAVDRRVRHCQDAILSARKLLETTERMLSRRSGA